MLYGEDVYVDYRFYEKVRRPALFPFGHGLSYTTFNLANLNIAVNDSTIDTTVTVANSGSRAGAEVVQVYISACTPSIGRPVKELKGFKKVFLESGQEREVMVKVDKSLATSFWDEARNAWIIEKGKYSIIVGTSSRSEKTLTAPFEVEETYWQNNL